MEEATVIGCLVCFTGNSRSKNQQNRLLLESASSKLELLPGYAKLSQDPSAMLSTSCENMAHKMPQDQDSGSSTHSKIQDNNSSPGMGAEREEGGGRVMKKSSWLPNAKGKRWPIQGWA